jgi:hypothetical protein
MAARSSRCVTTLCSITLILLQACATSVYEPLGKTARDSLTQVNANTFRVEYHVSPFTSEDVLDKYLRLRCAELTIQQGYDYFDMTQQFIVVSYRRSITVTVSMFKGEKAAGMPLLFDAKEVLGHELIGGGEK